MNLPLLSECFPATITLAELYGGWTEGPMFKKTFKADTLDEQIALLNNYLSEQGFNQSLDKDALEEDNVCELNGITVYRNVLGKTELLFIYHQPLMRSSIDEILVFLNKFRKDRNWSKFHTAKNLSMAISSEAGELLDHFLWDREENVDHEKIEKELADLIIYCIYLADNFKIDLLDAIVKKTIINDTRYSIDKSKGNAIKYNHL